MLNELAYQIYKANKAKGFWPDNPRERNFGEICALIHSEVSESMEAHRSGAEWPGSHDIDICMDAKDADAAGKVLDHIADFKSEFESRIKNSVPDELADTIIRVLDYCGAMNIDIESHINLKLAYNKMRPHKHGKLL